MSEPIQLPAPPGLDRLLADPGQWLTEMFNSAVMAIGSKTTDDAVQFLQSFGTGAVVFRTPAELTYANKAVTDLAGGMSAAADVGLAAIIAIGGINVIVRPHIREPYHGVLEVLPRVLLGGLMAHFSLSWAKFVIDLNNAICATVGGTMPDWSSFAHLPADGSVLLNLVAIVVYLVMGMLLNGQMLMRLALIDALLVIAPIALLCWILPQTYTWARLWFTTFFGTVFVQSIQVLVLRLGAELMQSLVPALGALSNNPLAGAHAWLMTLLLGIAVLQLTRKIPRIVQGLPAGIGVAYTGPSIIQMAAGAFNSSRNRKASNR